MIEVRCLGHIATSIGAKNLTVDADGLTSVELVERVRRLSKEDDPGFTVYNTLLIVDEGEAGVAAGHGVRLKDGQRVTLVPVSHGG